MYEQLKILILLILLLSCKNDDQNGLSNPTPPPSDLITSDLTGIDVKDGMTLVGKIVDENSVPIENVVVSDGYNSVETDEKGVYQLSRNLNSRFVFYSTPSEYEINTQERRPHFFEEIPSYYDIYRKDFTLKKMKEGAENKFTLFSIGDPQPKSGSDITRFQNETIQDIKDEAEKHDNIYSVVLGDLVFDKPDFLEQMKNLFAHTGITTFQVIGNHDHYEGATNDTDARKNFEDMFGPVNYSFNRGNAHIVVLDNIIYKGKQNYSIGFTDSQIQWLKNDLKYVPKNKLLIVCFHAPVRYSTSIQNSLKLYALIEPYQEVHIMSGHTHYNQNHINHNTGVYEHNTGTACGNWWSSTICGDGTPNGYGVYKINDNSIENWYYKSTFYNKDYQIRFYPPYFYGEKDGNVVANVWNADDKWKVELFEDGVKTGNMQRFTGYDPGAYHYFISIGKNPPSNPNEATTWFRRPDHLYKLKPKSNKSDIIIKATDRFGTTYIQNTPSTSFDVFVRYSN